MLGTLTKRKLSGQLLKVLYIHRISQGRIDLQKKKIIESNSWLHIGPPKKSDHLYKSTIQMLPELQQLGATITALGSLFQFPATLW